MAERSSSPGDRHATSVIWGSSAATGGPAPSCIPAEKNRMSLRCLRSFPSGRQVATRPPTSTFTSASSRTSRAAACSAVSSPSTCPQVAPSAPGRDVHVGEPTIDRRRLNDSKRGDSGRVRGLNAGDHPDRSRSAAVGIIGVREQQVMAGLRNCSVAATRERLIEELRPASTTAALRTRSIRTMTP